MPIEECAHCITKVIFPDTGICPACGTSKFVRPQKAREQIIYDKEKEAITEKINYLKKRIPGILFSGILLTLVMLLTLVFLMFAKGIFLKHLFIGIFFGLTLIGKALKNLSDKKELEITFNKKFQK